MRKARSARAGGGASAGADRPCRGRRHGPRSCAGSRRRVRPHAVDHGARRPEARRCSTTKAAVAGVLARTRQRLVVITAGHRAGDRRPGRTVFAIPPIRRARSARASRWRRGPGPRSPIWSSCSSIPTALDVGAGPLPLVTEALRGEGAVLVDGDGRRFMREHAGRASSRRATSWRGPSRGSRDGRRVFLDARAGAGRRLSPRVSRRRRALPAARASIRARSRSRCAPAAHYHMGGVATDARRAHLARRAVGLRRGGRHGPHGANRLASNSLLEAVVFGAGGSPAASQAQGAPRRSGPRPRRSCRSRPGSGCAGAMCRDVGVVRDARAGLERRLLARDRRRWQRDHADRRPALVAALLIAAAALRARGEPRRPFPLRLPGRRLARRQTPRRRLRISRPGRSPACRNAA